MQTSLAEQIAASLSAMEAAYGIMKERMTKPSPATETMPNLLHTEPYVAPTFKSQLLKLREILLDGTRISDRTDPFLTGNGNDALDQAFGLCKHLPAGTQRWTAAQEEAKKIIEATSFEENAKQRLADTVKTLCYKALKTIERLSPIYIPSHLSPEGEITTQGTELFARKTICAVELKQNLKKNPNYLGELTEPLEVEGFCNLNIADIQSTSPLLYVSGTCGISNNKTLKVLEGNFAGSLTINHTDITEINIHSRPSALNQWGADLSFNPNLLWIAGTFGYGINASNNSKLQSIRNAIFLQGITQPIQTSWGMVSAGTKALLRKCPALRFSPNIQGPEFITGMEYKKKEREYIAGMKILKEEQNLEI